MGSLDVQLVLHAGSEEQLHWKPLPDGQGSLTMAVIPTMQDGVGGAGFKNRLGGGGMSLTQYPVQPSCGMEPYLHLVHV